MGQLFRLESCKSGTITDTLQKPCAMLPPMLKQALLFTMNAVFAHGSTILDALTQAAVLDPIARAHANLKLSSVASTKE